MADVTLSKAVRSNLLNLQSTATMMGKVQERLATGLKVNSALDNPTNFFTASALSSRASDLGLLMDSVSNAVQTIAAADEGISSITKLVESAQSTARQALQTAATTEASGDVEEIVGTEDLSAYTAIAGDAGDLVINGIEVMTIATGDTGDEVYAALQAAAAESKGTDAEFTVELNDAGGVTIRSTYADSEIDTTGSTAATLTALGIGAASTVTVDDAKSPNAKRDELRVQYNELLVQIDDLAKDSGFNGVNLLDGDSLSVLFNEDGSSKLDIAGVGFGSAGLGLTELAEGAFDTNADINTVLDGLKAGIETLRTQASKFGSNLSVVETRQNFTKNMINVLETGAANLTLADSNEEAANLLALQTRQQLSSTSLSLAAQADQAVLQLL